MKVCGVGKNDILKNIYDLRGNCFEFTMKAGIAGTRVRRGRSS